MTVVLYDGVCGLCNRLVGFALPRDRHDCLRFASLQSPYARKLLTERGKDPDDLATVYVLTEDGHLVSKSRAILHMLDRLGGVWALASVFRIFPTFLLNFFYDRVANIRYRWFGKYETCPLPSPKDRAKFIEV